MASVKIEMEQMERLIAAMQSFQGQADATITEVLRDEGARLIMDEITLLLPRSGRHWQGKKKAARDAKPFASTAWLLNVKVVTKPDYNYLYFPDDGTTTLKHAGERYFMHAGALNASAEIVDRCIARLVRNFE